MNIVEQVSKLIDTEGAYSEWYDSTNSSKPKEPTTRQRYFRATYELLAIDIIKLCLNKTKEELRKDLIDFEIKGWKRLGVEIDTPEKLKIVTNKYDQIDVATPGPKNMLNDRPTI